MMFWKSSSSASSTSKANSSSSSSSAPLSAPGAAVPTYILSEQRRNELLLAARANRVSWIDGVDETTTDSSSSIGSSNALLSGTSLHAVGKARALGKHAGTSIPAPCQQALEAVATDLHEFFGTLDTLKSKIIPNSLIDDDSTRVRGPQAQASNSSDVGADGKPTVVAYRTIFQDLYENEALLAKWQRTQGHEISSPVRRKRMTGDDREMVFLLAFRELISILKNPKAAELVYQIQSFVKKFDTWDLKLMLRQRAARERPGGFVQAFVEKLVQQLRRNDKLLDFIEDSQQVGNNDDDQVLMATEYLCGSDEWSEDLLREVLEAFLMEKVYVKALTPSSQSANEDRVLFNRLQSLAFVEFKHLDLPTPETEELKQKWHHLVLQLKQMPLFMSPRRKMDCVLRVCQDLTKLLASQKGDGKFPSADEFLPGLIYLLLKANPKKLKRNLNFILEYRNPGKLVSEPGYFFTHLVSSVAFLEQVNGSLLTISPEEFEEGLRRSKQQILVEIETSPTVVGKASDDGDGHDKENNKRENAQARPKSQNPALPSVLEVRARRLAMMAKLASLK
ncbi:Vacuolar assembly/sorting protein vps9 [Globisporangium polare]